MLDLRRHLLHTAAMARKRDDGAGPPAWGEMVAMRREGASLIDASDEAIAERAAALNVDPRRLIAFVSEARRTRAARG